MAIEIMALYPLREAERVFTSVEKLKESTPLNLTETERSEILASERVLGGKLEEIRKEKVSSISFHPAFFATPAGRELCLRIVPAALESFEGDVCFWDGDEVIKIRPAEAVEAFRKVFMRADADTIERWWRVNLPFIQHLSDIKAPEAPAGSKEKPKKPLDELTVASQEYYMQCVKNPLLEMAKKHTDLRLDAAEADQVIPPREVTLVYTPENLVHKWHAYKKFVEGLSALGEGATSADQKDGFKLIADLYRARTNELRSSLAPDYFAVRRQAELLGIESLSDAEKEVLSFYAMPEHGYHKKEMAFFLRKRLKAIRRKVAKQGKVKHRKTTFLSKEDQKILSFFSLPEHERTKEAEEALLQEILVERMGRHAARIDKFSRGAAEFEDGNQVQLSEGLYKKALEQVSRIHENEANKEQSLAERGIDKDILWGKHISASFAAFLATDALKVMGVASEFDASTVAPKGKVPAEDKNWVAGVDASRKTAAVNHVNQGVWLPNKPQSIEYVLLTAINHEVGAHVLQHINKGNLKLALLETTGADRATLYKEAGAMCLENEASQALFGYEKPAATLYATLYRARLNGASFMECVAAGYNMKLEEFRNLYDLSVPEQQAAYEKKAKEALDYVMDRASRPFRGLDEHSEGPYITNSKDTMYLEQEMISENLKALGQEKLLYIAGLTPTAAAACKQLGILDLEKVQLPRIQDEEGNDKLLSQIMWEKKYPLRVWLDYLSDELFLKLWGGEAKPQETLVAIAHGDAVTYQVMKGNEDVIRLRCMQDVTDADLHRLDSEEYSLKDLCALKKKPLVPSNN